jgi:hypothetical protein
MRSTYGLLLTILALTAAPAEAAKILILTDPMTLERRVVVIDERGPDRYFLCAMPPSTTGCRDVTPRAR